MDHHELVERTQKLTGLSSAEAASRLLQVTTRAVAACLMPADRERWARHLPAELHDPMSATAYVPVQRAADVYAAVTQSEAISALSGIEHAQAAIIVLASTLPADEAALIARRLPTELGKLLDARRREQAGTHARAPSGAKPRHTGHISSSSVGSAHPLSEAQPGAPQAGSVGDWDDGRMDHTLGSARPDEDDNTLASGRPGSKHDLGDA